MNFNDQFDFLQIIADLLIDTFRYVFRRMQVMWSSCLQVDAGQCGAYIVWVVQAFRSMWEHVAQDLKRGRPQKTASMAAVATSFQQNAACLSTSLH